MLDTEKDKLMHRGSKYLSVGITEGGIPAGMIQIPWESTAHAYNMRTPDVYISPEDLQDENIWGMFEGFMIIGIYIWVPLDNYEFLSGLVDVQDILIMKGQNLHHTGFLADMRECRMLFLQDVRLESMEEIVAANTRKEKLFGGLDCIALWNCEVADLSALEKEKHYFSEFLVWQPEGADRKRWQAINAGIRKIYVC